MKTNNPISVRNTFSKFTLTKNNTKAKQIAFYLQNKYLNINTKIDLTKDKNRTRQSSKKQLLSASKEDNKRSLNKTKRELNEFAPSLDTKMIKMMNKNNMIKNANTSFSNKTIFNRNSEKQRLKLTVKYKEKIKNNKITISKGKKDTIATLNKSRHNITYDKPRDNTKERNNNKTNKNNQMHKEILKRNTVGKMATYRLNNNITNKDFGSSSNQAHIIDIKNNKNVQIPILTLSERVDNINKNKTLDCKYIDISNKYNNINCNSNCNDNCNEDYYQDAKHKDNDHNQYVIISDSNYLNIQDGEIESEDEKNEGNSGILNYHDVKDIIIYHNFDDIPREFNQLFNSICYEDFIHKQKRKLLQKFFP